MLTTADEYKTLYSESLGKRLKALKKRIVKIEKYQETPFEELNPDQIQALEKKPMLEFAIKELEEVSKTFTSIDKQELETKVLQDQETEKSTLERIDSAVQEAKKIPRENVKQILMILQTLSTRLEMSEPYTDSLTYQTLSTLYKYLSIPSEMDHAIEPLFKLLEEPKSQQELFENRMDFASLADAIQKMSMLDQSKRDPSKPFTFFTPSEIMPTSVPVPVAGSVPAPVNGHVNGNVVVDGVALKDDLKKKEMVVVLEKDEGKKTKYYRKKKSSNLKKQ